MPIHPEVIRSRANPLLKQVGAALAGRAPEWVVLEGDRLIEDALRAGWVLDTVLVAENRPDRAAALGALTDVRLVEPDALSRVSALKTSPGILALATTPEGWPVDALDLGERALVLVVAGVSDPGNLGALTRAAEAAGAGALVVVAGGASPWHPRALRGSMGSLLRLPVVLVGEADEAASGLAGLGIRNVVAATRGGVPLSSFDWSGPVALWVGGETGRAPEVCSTFEGVTIPMAGSVESLNVTVAASLLLFAAGRVEVGGEE